MGCVGSKPEESPAVKLCRERCSFLDSAVKERYAFAQAHLLYMQSLKRMGVSIRDFLEQDLDDDDTPYAAAVAAAPVMKSKAVKMKKGDLSKEDVETSPDELPHHIHSNSGSHLNFETDSDSDEDDGSLGSLHHHNHSNSHSRHPSGNYSGSPNLQPQRGYTMMNENENETLSYGGFGGGYGGFGGGGMQMNYMRKQPTQSVLYQQKPMSPDGMNMGQASYFPFDNNAPSSSSYQQFAGYSGYGGGQNGGYGGGGMGEASGSKPPPPPPSPPRGSAWDFLNFFEGGYNERYYAAYTPSRNSVDVRAAEGIPDLEDDLQHEVVKEVHGQQKFVGAGTGSGKGNGYGNHPKKNVVNEERKADDREDMFQARPSVVESEGMEYEVHVVDKKVVDSEKSESGRTRGGGHPMGVSEAVNAIQAQFDRAAEAGNELASMLEVGKHHYRSKFRGYHGKGKHFL